MLFTLKSGKLLTAPKPLESKQLNLKKFMYIYIFFFPQKKGVITHPRDFLRPDKPAHLIIDFTHFFIQFHILYFFLHFSAINRQEHLQRGSNMQTYNPILMSGVLLHKLNMQFPKQTSKSRNHIFYIQQCNEKCIWEITI